MSNKEFLKKALLVAVLVILSQTLLYILFNEIGYLPSNGVRYLIAVVLGITVGELVSRFSK